MAEKSNVPGSNESPAATVHVNISGAAVPASSHPADPAPSQTPASVSSPTATLQELKAAFPEAGAEFWVNCYEAHCDLHRAEKRWSGVLATRLAETQAALKSAQAGLPAVLPVSGASPVQKVGSARQRWLEAIDKFQVGGRSRLEAAMLANRENPGLRQELLAESA